MKVFCHISGEFSSVEECLAALKRGEIVLVTDDEDRENEGDCICAAEAKARYERHVMRTKNLAYEAEFLFAEYAQEHALEGNTCTSENSTKTRSKRKISDLKISQKTTNAFDIILAWESL